MTDIERLENSVDGHEDFRAFPYRDTKKLWTFAIGRCLERNPLSGEEWRYLLNHSHIAVSITRDGADWLKWREITACEAALERMLPFWKNLNDARQNVLIEMAFQMGIGGVMRFTNMIAAIQAEDWKHAEAEGLDSDWGRESSDTRERAVQLMKQMRTGEFPPIAPHK